jgi:prepilin-type N-terminal cleavage/methylation domain-containing protein
MHKQSNENQAFSLIELAVVISIIALVGGLSLSVGTTQVKVTKIRQATQTTDNVKTALLTYVKKAGRYPCPANPALASTNVAYGTEVTGCDAACPAGLICNGNAIEGALPFKTIGLSEAASYDSWDNKLTYVVDKAHVSSSAYGNGSLPVYDAAGNEITASPVLGKAIFLLLSHGSDGKGAYKRDGTLRAACGAATSDSENCDGDGIYRYTSFNDAGNATTTPTYYQDFLSWHTQDKVEEITNLISTEAMGVNSLAVSDMHNCIITSAGKLQCSGRDLEEQLGNGVLGDTTSFTDEGNGFNDWISIAGDYGGGCGIRNNGRAYCWGLNTSGQLGDATNTNRNIPTEVNGSHTDWTHIVKADSYACGIRNSGRAYCWGAGGNGNLGDGLSATTNTPIEVSGGATDWVMLSVGETDTTTCGLRTSGRIYCWGKNTEGNVGDGTNTDRSVPTEVAGGFSDWKFLAGIGRGSCAIRNNGRAYCWGVNTDGQLGDASNINRNAPTEVNGSHTDWKMIFKGYRGTCGIRGTGVAYCWGNDDNGQIGTGVNTAGSNTPVAINTPHTDFVTIRTNGVNYACAVRANGDLYCWGQNGFGQFGNASTSWSIVAPTLIPGVSVNTD